MTAMTQGFHITMKGSEIQAHIKEMVSEFETQANFIEKKVAEARAKAHEEVDREPEQRVSRQPIPCGPTLTQIVEEGALQRKELLHLARKHQLLIDHIDAEETFVLSREDMMFLRLVGGHPALVGGGYGGL